MGDIAWPYYISEHAVLAESGPQCGHDTSEAKQRLCQADPVIAEFLHQVWGKKLLGGYLVPCCNAAASIGMLAHPKILP